MNEIPITSEKKISKTNLWTTSIIYSLFISCLLYILFLQTPYVSRREIALALLFWLFLIPLVYLLLSRFLVPRLNTFTPKARRNWILLSVGIGLLFALVTRPPQVILLFPVHDLEISVPAGDPERIVTLEYAKTSLRDISFGEFKQVGNWERTEEGLTQRGSEPASLSWSGRMGEEATLVFANLPGIEGVLAGLDIDLISAIYGNIISTRVTSYFDRSTGWAFSSLPAYSWPVSRSLFAPCPLTRFI